MPSVVLATAGRLETRTGGSIYNRRMAEALRARGWTVEVRELDGRFPLPSDAALAQADAVYATVPDGSVVLADGLAFCAMPDVIGRHASRLRFVALIHLPIAAAVGLDERTASDLASAERRALAMAAHVVVTGSGGVPLLEPYALEPGVVTVVEPGVAPAPLARGSRDGIIRLLSVATVNAGKGYDVLLQALASRRMQTAWRLSCAGSLTREPETSARVTALCTDLGLDDRVTFCGELIDTPLERAWDAADVFVLATRRETYGMAVTEALARGLPVVSTTTGAIPSLVGDEAGVLVAPDDAEGLADALGRVIDDARLRSRLADGAVRRRASLPAWEDAAARMAAVLEGHVRG